jgi:UDP-N-acetylglucosamine/UDP-N-acetylgalactosamine diphosphorylase
MKLGKFASCCLALLTPTLFVFSDSSILDDFMKKEPQLFRFWSCLDIEQKGILANEIEQLDSESIAKQKELIQYPVFKPAKSLEAFEDFAFSGNQQDIEYGQRLIEQGRLGCLILAGGQGTRLKIQGPKGLYPISVIKNKTLFQLCAEKVAAASRLAGRPLNLAIMTSPENDDETRAYFMQNEYFGLSHDQIYFCIQGTLPFLDVNGKLFLETPSKICTGPDGNGHWLLSFLQSGIYHEWRRQGIDYLHVILVDNPLADPFDPELIGFHSRQQVEITLKCTEKTRPDEKVGVLVKEDGQCAVVEYSELLDEEKQAKRSDGRLKHCCANLSLFCFSLSFVERMGLEGRTLPLHKAWKAARYVDEEGQSQMSITPIAWKFETFIFDWLMYTDRVAALLYPREECFAPLKNFEGLDSPNTVRKALQENDRCIIKVLTGLPAPEFPFELAADFYYPTESLRTKWKGRAVTSDYVE